MSCENCEHHECFDCPIALGWEEDQAYEEPVCELDDLGSL